MGCGTGLNTQRIAELYPPSHLAEAGFVIEYQALELFVWGFRVYYRVAFRPQDAASEFSLEKPS